MDNELLPTEPSLQPQLTYYYYWQIFKNSLRISCCFPPLSPTAHQVPSQCHVLFFNKNPLSPLRVSCVLTGMSVGPGACPSIPVATPQRKGVVLPSSHQLLIPPQRGVQPCEASLAHAPLLVKSSSNNKKRENRGNFSPWSALCVSLAF